MQIHHGKMSPPGTLAKEQSRSAKKAAPQPPAATQRRLQAQPYRPIRVGYGRVSTDAQNLFLQLDALGRAGCARIFTDEGVSGAEFSRPGLERAMASLKAGDTLVVWRLDRLGRSLQKLVELISDLGRRKIQFESISEAINTKSSGGILVFHMMAALAEFERSLISERTRAGLAAARARGKHIGRKHALTASQQREALLLLATEPVAAVAKRFDIHPRTLKRLLSANSQFVKHGSEASQCTSPRSSEGVVKSKRGVTQNNPASEPTLLQR